MRPAAGPDRPALDLDRPRELDGLLNLAGALWVRHFRVFVLTALAVVGAVDLAVYGLGEGLLFGGYEEDPTIAWSVVGAIAITLVTTPIVTAIHVRVVQSLAAEPQGGPRLGPGAAITAGLEVFPRVLAVVVVSTIGVLLGLLALILPGLYLFVRWFVAPQAAVVEDPGTTMGALRRSAALVRGRWWRTAAVVLLLVVVGGVVATVIALPFDLLGDQVDSGAVALAGVILGETVAVSFTALVATLLYFDLRARHTRQASSTPAPPRAPGERTF